MRLFPGCFLIFWALPLVLTAQQSRFNIVRGQVTDAETTLPMPRVTVSAVGAAVMRYTDDEGRYEIRPSGRPAVRPARRP